MRSQKGNVFIDVAIGLAIICVILTFLVMIMNALVNARNQGFYDSFGVNLNVRDMRTPLPKEERDILQPLVDRRLHEVCDIKNEAPPADAGAVEYQKRLYETYKRVQQCQQATLVARREGFLPQ